MRRPAHIAAAAAALAIGAVFLIMMWHAMFPNYFQQCVSGLENDTTPPACFHLTPAQQQQAAVQAAWDVTQGAG